MSNAALTWAFNSDLASSGAKFVLVALADHASDHSGEDWTCFPSNERLSEFTSIPLRTLERHLSWLFDEGWITRVTERDKRGRLKDRRYWLHRDPERRTALKASRAAGEQAVEIVVDEDAAGCPPANMAGGEMADPPAILAADHPPKTASPPANLAGGLYIAEPPIEPSIEPSPGVRAGDHAVSEKPGFGRSVFDGVCEVWSKADPDRVAKPVDWPIWQAAAKRCPGGEAALAHAARRYLAESGEVRRRHCRSFGRWLAEDRWENWLGEAVRAAGGGDPLASFPDASIRQAVATIKGDGWVGSYLDRARWDEATRTITACTRIAGERLRDLRIWTRLGVTVRDPEMTTVGDGR